MANDVLLNKAATIERCLQRIREEYIDHEDALEIDYTRQDSIILNLRGRKGRLNARHGK